MKARLTSSASVGLALSTLLALPAPVRAEDHSLGITVSGNIAGRHFRGTESQPGPEGRPMLGLGLELSYLHPSGHGASLGARALGDFPPESHYYTIWLVDGRYRWDLRTDRGRRSRTSYAVTAGPSLAVASHGHFQVFPGATPVDPEPLDHFSLGPGIGALAEHHVSGFAVAFGGSYRVLGPVGVQAIKVEHIVTLALGVGFGITP